MGTSANSDLGAKSTDTNGSSGRELIVVVPVYNEQDSIESVVREWMSELSRHSDNFEMLAIDDGSRDRTLEILRVLESEFSGALVVVTRANRGHGQTCFEGYRRAWQAGARHIFQIDSDGQCDPRYFRAVWQLRTQSDVVYGVRKWRDDGFVRTLVSTVLRVFLLIAFRTNCPDANVPYRLMKADRIIGAVNLIPATFNLANVALAVLLRRDRRCSHAFVPIGFRERYGGEPSVKLSLFGRRAGELYRELRRVIISAEAADTSVETPGSESVESV